MAFRKHGVGEILGTEGQTESTAKTATVTWTEADQEALEAENREEEQES
jgi:hypothetical protein